MIQGVSDPSRDVPALRTGLGRAAEQGIPAALLGEFWIDETVELPRGTRIEGNGAAVLQLKPRTALLRTNGNSDIRIHDVQFRGLTSDYVNASSVHAATGVYINRGSEWVTVAECRFIGLAGSAVMIQDGNDITIRNCTIVGPGPRYIRGTENNFSAGIVSHAKDGMWIAEFNDISGYAQGMVTGPHQSDYRIFGNRIHGILGQHGLYLESTNRGIVHGNIIWDTGLLGMKIQVPPAAGRSAENVVVSSNVIQDVGDAGILLTNIDGRPQGIQRVIVSSNLIDGTGADGITLVSTHASQVHDNIVSRLGRHGISVRDSSAVDVYDNRIDGPRSHGVSVTNSTGWSVENNRIQSPGRSGEGAGVYISESSAGGLVIGNRIGNGLENVTEAVVQEQTGAHIPARGVLVRDNHGPTGHSYASS